MKKVKERNKDRQRPDFTKRQEKEIGVSKTQRRDKDRKRDR